MSEEIFLLHWLTQSMLDDTTFSKTAQKMDKRMIWVREQLESLNKPDADLVLARQTVFRDILDKHLVINKVCLTSNELHSIWDACEEYLTIKQ